MMGKATPIILGIIIVVLVLLVVAIVVPSLLNGGVDKYIPSYLLNPKKKRIYEYSHTAVHELPKDAIVRNVQAELVQAAGTRRVVLIGDHIPSFIDSDKFYVYSVAGNVDMSTIVVPKNIAPLKGITYTKFRISQDYDSGFTVPTVASTELRGNINFTFWYVLPSITPPVAQTASSSSADSVPVLPEGVNIVEYRGSYIQPKGSFFVNLIQPVHKYIPNDRIYLYDATGDSTIYTDIIVDRVFAVPSGMPVTDPLPYMSKQSYVGYFVASTRSNRDLTGTIHFYYWDIPPKPKRPPGAYVEIPSQYSSSLTENSVIPDDALIYEYKGRITQAAGSNRIMLESHMPDFIPDDRIYIYNAGGDIDVWYNLSAGRVYAPPEKIPQSYPRPWKASQSYNFGFRSNDVAERDLTGFIHFFWWREPPKPRIPPGVIQVPRSASSSSNDRDPLISVDYTIVRYSGKITQKAGSNRIMLGTDFPPYMPDDRMYIYNYGGDIDVWYNLTNGRVYSVPQGMPSSYPRPWKVNQVYNLGFISNLTAEQDLVGFIDLIYWIEKRSPSRHEYAVVPKLTKWSSSTTQPPLLPPGAFIYEYKGPYIQDAETYALRLTGLTTTGSAVPASIPGDRIYIYDWDGAVDIYYNLTAGNTHSIPDGMPARLDPPMPYLANQSYNNQFMIKDYTEYTLTGTIHLVWWDAAIPRAPSGAYMVPWNQPYSSSKTTMPVLPEDAIVVHFVGTITQARGSNVIMLATYAHDFIPGDRIYIYNYTGTVNVWFDLTDEAVYAPPTQMPDAYPRPWKASQSYNGKFLSNSNATSDLSGNIDMFYWYRHRDPILPIGAILPVISDTSSSEVSIPILPERTIIHEYNGVIRQIVGSIYIKLDFAAIQIPGDCIYIYDWDGPVDVMHNLVGGIAKGAPARFPENTARNGRVYMANQSYANVFRSNDSPKATIEGWIKFYWWTAVIANPPPGATTVDRYRDLPSSSSLVRNPEIPAQAIVWEYNGPFYHPKGTTLIYLGPSAHDYIPSDRIYIYNLGGETDLWIDITDERVYAPTRGMPDAYPRPWKCSQTYNGFFMSNTVANKDITGYINIWYWTVPPTTAKIPVGSHQAERDKWSSSMISIPTLPPALSIFEYDGPIYQSVSSNHLMLNNEGLPDLIRDDRIYIYDWSGPIDIKYDLTNGIAKGVPDRFPVPDKPVYIASQSFKDFKFVSNYTPRAKLQGWIKFYYWTAVIPKPPPSAWIVDSNKPSSSSEDSVPVLPTNALLMHYSGPATQEMGTDEIRLDSSMHDWVPNDRIYIYNTGGDIDLWYNLTNNRCYAPAPGMPDAYPRPFIASQSYRGMFRAHTKAPRKLTAFIDIWYWVEMREPRFPAGAVVPPADEWSATAARTITLPNVTIDVQVYEGPIVKTTGSSRILLDSTAPKFIRGDRLYVYDWSGPIDVMHDIIRMQVPGVPEQLRNASSELVQDSNVYMVSQSYDNGFWSNTSTLSTMRGYIKMIWWDARIPTPGPGAYMVATGYESSSSENAVPILPAGATLHHYSGTITQTAGTRDIRLDTSAHSFIRNDRIYLYSYGGNVDVWYDLTDRAKRCYAPAAGMPDAYPRPYIVSQSYNGKFIANTVASSTLTGSIDFWYWTEYRAPVRPPNTRIFSDQWSSNMSGAPSLPSQATAFVYDGPIVQEVGSNIIKLDESKLTYLTTNYIRNDRIYIYGWSGPIDVIHNLTIGKAGGVPTIMPNNAAWVASQSYESGFQSNDTAKSKMVGWITFHYWDARIPHAAPGATVYASDLPSSSNPYHGVSLPADANIYTFSGTMTQAAGSNRIILNGIKHTSIRNDRIYLYNYGGDIDAWYNLSTGDRCYAPPIGMPDAYPRPYIVNQAYTGYFISHSIAPRNLSGFIEIWYWI